MLTPLLLALTVMAPSDRVVVGSSTLTADEPPVRIWLNGNRQFEPGDAARVQVEARDDGYLLVLHFDTDGRVRVLFPLDPSDDGFVRGGRRYEVRNDVDRESFRAGDTGSGFVYVALAPDPWRIRDWSRGNVWDYDRIAIDLGSTDPERDLTRLVENLSTDRGFDYDIIEYFVDDVEVVRYEYSHNYFSGAGVYSFDPYCDPYWSSGWYCGGRSGVVVSYGSLYRNDWWSIGYGPSWYWPSRYGYSYRDYGYGRGSSYYSYYRPWIVTGPTYRPGNNGTFIAGRSRDYIVGRPGAGGFSNTAPSGRSVVAAGDAYRPRTEADNRARPVSQRPTAAQESRGRPAVDRSTDRGADRARPTSGATRPEARPSSERPSVQRSPATTSRPAPSRPARARPRGGNDTDSPSSSASRAPAPQRPVAQDAGRARASTSPTRSEPVKTTKAAPSRRATPSVPTTRTAPSRASTPPRASAPTRASTPSRAAPRSAPPRPAASKAPPARSRTRPPGL